jgi:putative glutamine amidotransferase
LLKWIIQAGFLPVVVPNVLFDTGCSNQEQGAIVLEHWLQTQSLGALLLSGGNNIGDFPQRDATECYLLAWAEANNIPTLGICRGMQMMAVWAGAQLREVGGHVRTRHQLTAHGGVGDWPVSVNSYHDWNIQHCPKQFKVSATAENGDIEAMCHQTLPWEGWMWHPEREQKICIEDTMRVKRLFNGKQ